MKKNIVLSILAGGLVVLASCNKSDYDLNTMIPEYFHKIVYLKTYGKQELSLYATGQDNKFEYSILKGGAMPELTALADLKVLTQEELDEKYSVLENVKYKLIEEDAYTIDNTHFDFSSEEHFKPFTISLDAEAIAEDSEADTEAVWVLPLYVSSETDSVNANKNSIFLQVNNIFKPEIGFKSTTLEYHEETSFSVSVPVVLNVENTGWDITCKFGSADADYVTSYNEANGTGFQLFEGDYMVDESITLTQDVPEASINVTVDAAGLPAGDYLLPVRITETSMFGTQGGKGVYPIAIRIKGTEMNRTNWEAFASSVAQGDGGGDDEGPNNGGAGHAIDGDFGTFWHSKWSNPIPTPPHYLWFDTKETKTLTHVQIARRAGFDYAKDCEIYVNKGSSAISYNDPSWIKVATIFIEDTDDIQTFGVVPTECRQFMIKVLTSNNNNKCACFSEVYALYR